MVPKLGIPAVWLEGWLPSPGTPRACSCVDRDTDVCMHMHPGPCCRAHAGEDTGTRPEGRSRGLARPHSHLLQKQKWQPHQHGCDSSPGETAPAVAVKALAPTGPWQSALRRLCLDSDTAAGGAAGLQLLVPKEQRQAWLLGPTEGVGGPM